jgi:hypothetical protein
MIKKTYKPSAALATSEKLLKKKEVQIVYEDNSPNIGSYDDEIHRSDDCDKCNKRVGINNLIQLPFIYHDYNDHVHADVRPPYMYHQYYVCKECVEK